MLLKIKVPIIRDTEFSKISLLGLVPRGQNFALRTGGIPSKFWVGCANHNLTVSSDSGHEG